MQDFHPIASSHVIRRADLKFVILVNVEIFHGGKERRRIAEDEAQKCVRDESVKFDQPRSSSIMKALDRDVCDEKETCTLVSSRRFIRASSGVVNLGVRLMNWSSSGVSGSVISKRFILNLSSWGASIKVTRLSKYLPAPRNSKEARKGRTAGDNEGECRPSS